MKRLLIHLSWIAVLFTTSCQSKNNETETEERSYSVTNPLVKDTTTIKDYVCQIHSIQHIELRALEKGYLQNIYVDEGQYINKGQLMFQIIASTLLSRSTKSSC